MKILAITMLNVVGSGYGSLSIPIFMELIKNGHEIKVIGVENNGSQHSFPFSIIPATNMQESLLMIENFWHSWHFDALMVLIDLNIQQALLSKLGNHPFKYIGIFPIEADPLCFDSAMTIVQMDKPFVISEFGTNEAHKKGIETAEHLKVGIDTMSWQPPTPDERTEIRKAYGCDDETFVVISVADNHERKNWPAHFFAFKEFLDKNPNSKYLIVTREHLYAGWNLRELADTVGIPQDKLIIIERGLSFKKLWMVYAAADALLLLSKAEGAGLPVYEAMAMKIPVIGTNCTGIRESLSEGRGMLVSWEYMHIDPFANGHRYWADPGDAAKKLIWLAEHRGEHAVKEMIEKAHAWISARTWEAAVEGILAYLENVKHEQEEIQKISSQTREPAHTVELPGDGGDPGPEQA